MSGPTLASVNVGDELPGRAHTCDHVQLFFYNAILWNAHRIHYDLPYATQVEGYPGLVIAGPQIGDWMLQCVDNWIGDAGMIVGVEYSNRIAAYLGETLTTGATVTGVDPEKRIITLEAFVKNADGDVITPGVATVRMNP